MKSRTVVCRSCKAIVDPFHVLQELARDWEAVTYYEERRTAAALALEALQDEAKRVKAQIRRGMKNSEVVPALYEAIVARMGQVTTFSQQYEFDRWLRRAVFTWFTPEQNEAVRLATIQMERRIQDTARSKKRTRRVVRVLQGGKK